MMSLDGVNSINALPDPLSMIVQMMSVEAEAISLGAEIRPAAGSINAEVVTDPSGIVTIVASETITTGTNFTVLGSAVEV